MGNQVPNTFEVRLVPSWDQDAGDDRTVEVRRTAEHGPRTSYTDVWRISPAELAELHRVTGLTLDSVVVIDEAGTNGSVVVARGNVAEAIRFWYPEPSAEVTELVDGLQAAITRHEDTSGYETALGIKIQY